MSTQKKIPKIPCIALNVRIVTENDDPLISKIDSIPYIDKTRKYPIKNDRPMICIAQINMDHIFSLLKKKKSSKKIRAYFRQYPQTGIIQFYLPYSEEIRDDGDDIYIRYIKEYDLKKHDIRKEKKLQKIYADYREKHGCLFELPDSRNKKCSIYITNAVYAYDFLNSTMQGHVEWDEDMENMDTEYMDEYDRTYDNTIQLGGFPYHLQADFEFDENDDLMLLSIVNSILGLNIGIKKDNLQSLEFNDLLFDLSY